MAYVLKTTRLVV